MIPAPLAHPEIVITTMSRLAAALATSDGQSAMGDHFHRGPPVEASRQGYERFRFTKEKIVK